MRSSCYHSFLKSKPTLQLVFVRTKRYDYLMGVILALTGCEATFAKLVAKVHNLYRLTCALWQPWAVQCIIHPGVSP